MLRSKNSAGAPWLDRRARPAAGCSESAGPSPVPLSPSLSLSLSLSLRLSRHTLTHTSCLFRVTPPPGTLHALVLYSAGHWHHCLSLGPAAASRAVTVGLATVTSAAASAPEPRRMNFRSRVVFRASSWVTVFARPELRLTASVQVALAQPERRALSQLGPSRGRRSRW